MFLIEHKHLLVLHQDFAFADRRIHGCIHQAEDEIYRTRSEIALFQKVESAISDRGYYIVSWTSLDDMQRNHSRKFCFALRNQVQRRIGIVTRWEDIP